MDKGKKILIIGAGVFGLSTALELSRRGYSNITILDRHVPPVPDGSSVDISRIVRPDYADKFYAKMGMEALAGWQKEFSAFFYRSGLLCAQAGTEFGNAYLKEAKSNLENFGARVDLWPYTGREVTERYPGIHGDLSQTSGYCNLDAGWVDAAKSIEHLAKLCKEIGATFLSGGSGTVTELITSETGGVKTITGIRTANGKVLTADIVIMATGAWTSHLIGAGNRFISTGQPVGYMQLTPEEADEMRGNPVMINLSTGWFAFPPTPGDNILKMARHGYGFETTHTSNSTRYSAPSIASQSDYLPADAEQALRDGLALFLPKFKDRPFSRRRLCWYTDTPKGDFIVDYHPEYSNLFVATGGSGQKVNPISSCKEPLLIVISAFKFLPVLGRYVVDSLEGVASAEQKEKWKWAKRATPIMPGDGSRGGPPRRVLTKEEQSQLF
ncbi:fructosyl amino acid oxidase [Aureobasidium sp. EXF-3400]|nr:fructosyl amino acid oxidase [Aureobasidium sp. EXF-12344]KAI4779773.1 fructosyl amino acid oxidase [Aureobasidium sp. EXF-3400]